MDHIKPLITKFGTSIKYWKKYNVNEVNCNGDFNSYISELAVGEFTEFIYIPIFSILDNVHKTFYLWFHMINIYQFCGLKFWIWIIFLYDIYNFDPNKKIESTKLIDIDHMKPSIKSFVHIIKNWKNGNVNKFGKFTNS